MTPQNYILVSKTAVPCDDIRQWSAWMADVDHRRVAYTKINQTTISTVFLGTDQQWEKGQPPVLYETMVFGDLEPIQQRYSIWEQAEAGHAALVAKFMDLNNKITEGKKITFYLPPGEITTRWNDLLDKSQRSESGLMREAVRIALPKLEKKIKR